MTELAVTSYGRRVIGEKSRLISLVLSFFLFAGFGMIYAGNRRKGIIFFIADLVMLLMAVVSYVCLSVSLALSVALTGFDDLNGILVPCILICLGFLLSLVLRVVSMVFGYKNCTENNTLWVAYLENS